MYASSDVLVFPSATDTFGNVVLEAQASGIPIIVSDSGGPCENLIPNVTGLVTPAGDAPALAQAIAALASDSERRKKMGLGRGSTLASAVSAKPSIDCGECTAAQHRQTKPRRRTPRRNESP